MYRSLLVVLALPFTGCIVEHAPDDEPVVLPPAVGQAEGATPRSAARDDDSDRATEAPEPPADGAAPGPAETPPDLPADAVVEPAPFADAQAELASCVEEAGDPFGWELEHAAGLRVIDAVPLGPAIPGQAVEVELWLGNAAGHTFGGYPGLRLVGPDGPVDNWFYAIFACDRQMLTFTVEVPADLAPGDALALEAEAVTLGCARADDCGGHRVAFTLPVVAP
jgi:hypothetical protein